MTPTSFIARLGGILVMLSLSACAGRQNQTVDASSSQDEHQRETVTPTLPHKEVPPRYETTAKVAIKTSLGTMTVALFGKAAPKTVANFLKYVDSGYYNGKIFHRIIDGFMVQGGGFDENLLRGEVDAPIHLELIPGLKHRPGVISMARQPDDIHSATAQFFICTADAPQLNGTYAAFGQLIHGEAVLDAISRVPTHSVDTEYGKMNDVPIKPVLIESISRL